MIIIVLIGYVILSLVIAIAGQNRKFGFWGYFFCSLLLTPILGLLFVIASGRRTD